MATRARARAVARSGRLALLVSPCLAMTVLSLLLLLGSRGGSASPLPSRALIGGGRPALAWTRPHTQSAVTGAAAQQQQPQYQPPGAMPFQPMGPMGARQPDGQPLLAYAGARGRGGRGRGARRSGGMGGGQGGFDLSNWTNRLLAINVVVFLLQQVDPRVTLLGAKNDALLRRGEWHRLLTPMLLHGDVQHLLANSYTLYNLGHFIEPLFGGPTYLALYVLSGIAGNGLSFLSRRAPIAIGASTAVSGLLGAVGIFCLRHRKVWNLEGPLRSVTQAVVINGVLGASSRNIDNFGHLGGLLGGIACGFLFGPNLVPVQGPDGRFRGYANLPLLQTAVASIRRRLGQGKAVRPSSQAPAQQGGRRRAALRPQQQQGQEQQQKKPNWLTRLGSFLHRGGDSSSAEGRGGGYAGAAFVGPLGLRAVAGPSSSNGGWQRGGWRPRAQPPRVWRAPYALPLL